MKYFRKLPVLFVILFYQYATATTPWGNCLGTPQVEPVQKVFWNSTADGGAGPDYQLKSGQIYSNGVAVCRNGQTLKSADWMKELKNGLGPSTGPDLAKPSSYTVIHS